ncbi:hypothetical protein DM819_21800 [Pseudomonas hunanensis]|uniref:Uncharacterized protein n=1 Tax=Pseudomonas hunanensis TaxID=1247546 RepID=A0ABD6NBD2_9PSED|nr:hypothetical protein [Pseudomonas hunanensis]NWL48427.1 hypothetical protein [Pseudomonas hunanensis]
MEPVITPTSTLLQIMSQLCEQPPHIPALHALGAVFEINPRNTRALSRTIIEVEELSDQAIEAVKLHVFGDQEMYLEPLVEVRSFFDDLDLTAAWDGYRKRITPSLLQGLKFADHFLTNSIALASGPKSAEVLEILARLDSLIEDCLTSGLNPELQQFFASTLNKLRNALNEYRIYGDAALENVLNEVSGAINRKSKEIKTEYAEAKGFLADVFDAIGRMNDLVSASENVSKALMGSGVVYFLPHLT